MAVELEDSFGNVATNYTGTVKAALTTNPGSSTLGGTTSVGLSPTSTNPGFATLTGLSLNKVGSGYVLTVSDTGSPVSSAASTINVTPAAPRNWW